MDAVVIWYLTVGVSEIEQQQMNEKWAKCKEKPISFRSVTHENHERWLLGDYLLSTWKLRCSISKIVQNTILMR